jgi:hypothetical protein
LGGAVSWVYKHGAELEDQNGKYWLCQRCHEKGDYKCQKHWLASGCLDLKDDGDDESDCDGEWKQQEGGGDDVEPIDDESATVSTG